ncbi:unnamed protein product [Effrenium voratum]|nr:unnamed protein product [Effrenium voratum]
MGQAAEARVQHARRRLQAASASEQSACATQQELEARHGRLTARLAQLTAAVESLRRRFAAGAAELAEEQARSAEVLSGPSSVRRKLQEMTEEGQRLRETIAEMEADQRELQQAADVAGAELLQLSAESQRLRAQRGELQWTLDKLRQTLAHQHGELADDTRGTALTLEELRLAENEVQTYQSELAERVREEEEALQDLRHMTRENQLLHHELRLAQQRHQVLEDATQEHEAQKLPMMQELRGKEFQCEELRKACQEVAQQRLRNEAAVEELAQQVESSYMEIQELQGSLQGLEQNEETTRGSFHKSDSELAVLRTRMHEVTQCLEMQEFAQEQRKADQSRLRWVAGSQQTAINEAMMGAAAVAAQADSLRAEVASTQRKLDQARERLADETRRGQEAARSQAKLQALLAQQRQMHWQREAECSALRRPKLPSEGERQMLEQVEELERKMSREVKFLAEEAANLNTELAQSKATP